MTHNHLELKEKCVFVRIFIIDREESFFDPRDEEQLLDYGIHVTSGTRIFQSYIIAGRSTLHGRFILSK